MVVDQQSLLEDQDRLEELHRSYDGEARLNESFIVLTIGASLIASLGLVADNNAVIIGAMVVAPWINAAGGGVRDSDRAGQAVVTITDHPCRRSRDHLDPVDGVGLIARSQGLLVVEALPEQIVARLEPNTFDLGIALAAGAIATYAKVNPSAVSSMAGTAIAVALVPPVCVMELMLSGPDISSAQGPALLYAANLLGILIGGITVLAIREPYFRDKLGAAAAHAYPCCWHWVWPWWWVKNCMGGMTNTDSS